MGLFTQLFNRKSNLFQRAPKQPDMGAQEQPAMTPSMDGGMPKPSISSISQAQGPEAGSLEQEQPGLGH